MMGGKSVVGSVGVASVGGAGAVGGAGGARMLIKTTARSLAWLIASALIMAGCASSGGASVAGARMLIKTTARSLAWLIASALIMAGCASSGGASVAGANSADAAMNASSVAGANSANNSVADTKQISAHTNDNTSQINAKVNDNKSAQTSEQKSPQSPIVWTLDKSASYIKYRSSYMSLAKFNGELGFDAHIAYDESNARLLVLNISVDPSTMTLKNKAQQAKFSSATFVMSRYEALSTSQNTAHGIAHGLLSIDGKSALVDIEVDIYEVAVLEHERIVGMALGLVFDKSSYGIYPRLDDSVHIKAYLQATQPNTTLATTPSNLQPIDD